MKRIHSFEEKKSIFMKKLPFYDKNSIFMMKLPFL
jgi:hypothetical protein